jgi:D-alanine-D-alanine ligase
MRTVAVLRGGIGDEHDVSLRSGKTVLTHIPQDMYTVLDVFIDRDGVWHMHGIPKKPEHILGCTDVVFNALHGTYGEDGTVQELLDRLGVPYTGSRTLASKIGINKTLTKEMVECVGIRVPRSMIVSVSPSLEDDILRAFRSFPQPSVIKPNTSGSSVGVTLAKNFTEFKEGIRHAFQYAKDVIVEEYVKGKEATLGVIDNFRGSALYALPPVEIIPPPQRSFFDYDAKYSGETEERCPGNFTREEVEALQQSALKAHTALGLAQYSRSDFIVTTQGVYFLEVNTLPGLTEQSLLPKSLSAVGIPLSEFIVHILTLAQEKR